MTQCYCGICCRCVSVCLSITSQYCIETTGQIERVFVMRGFLPPVPHCYNEIWVSPKIKVLPSGTLYRTSDLENFGAPSRLHCPQTVVVDGRVCWRHLYNNCESWLFTTSPSAVTLRLHYCDLLSICHTICFYS